MFQETSKWIVDMHPKRTTKASRGNISVVIVVFAWSGGSVMSQKVWTDSFWSAFCESEPSSKEPVIIGLELPGRRMRFGEPLIKSFIEYRDIATEILLEAKLSDGTALLDAAPYVLAGYSLGSLVAHQVAQNLEQRAANPPAGYIPLACKNPGAYSGILSKRVKKKTDMTDDEVVELLRKQGGTPELLLKDKETLAFFLPPIKGDYFIEESYNVTSERWGAEHQYQLSCPMLIVSSTDDPFVAREHLDGWSEATSGVAEKQIFESGGHFFLNNHHGALGNKIANFVRAHTL